MKQLLTLLLLACNMPSAESSVTQHLESGFTVLHVMTDSEGNAPRGNGALLGDRVYWMMGERGPNSTPNCSSTAHWNDIEHLKHCPGSLVSVGRDGSFRVDVGFQPLDEHGQNDGGYHPYGSPAATLTGCLVGVTQVGGHPVGAGVEAATVKGFGTLWRYCPSTGQLETLHNFFGVPRALDGEYPMGAVAALPDGRVCGTTKDGGLFNRGTVWCWSETSFVYNSLTVTVYGGVTYAAGLLHFTSFDGGDNGKGMYMTADPTTLTIAPVASFAAYDGPTCCDDNTPIQAPTLLSNGVLVQSREFAGPFGAGSLVKLSDTGVETVLEMEEVNSIIHPLNNPPRFSNFTGGMPNGRVTEASSGLLVGAATYGGAHGAGGIYQVARDGTLASLLYSFSPDGPSYPYGGLITVDGVIYGSTFNGSALFSIVPPTSTCSSL